MRLTALACLLIVAFAVSLNPENAVARARQEKLPDSSRLVLDNGFTAVLIPNRSTPLVTSVVVVGAGSSRETAASNGISHMLEHLLFDGTSRRSQEQIASEMDRFGVINNAHTGTDQTSFFVMATREQFGRALDIQSDMLFEPTFPEDRLAREREIIANEIAKDQAGDDAAIAGLFASRLYRGTGLELPVTGTPESVRSLSRQEISAYHRAWYVPNNMTAVIMGDFEDAEMEPLVRRYFGGAAPGLLPETSRGSAADTPKVNPLALGLTHARRAEGPGRHVWMGAPAPGIGSAGFDAASLLASLLGVDLARAVNARLSPKPGSVGSLGFLTGATVSVDAHAAASAFQVRAAMDDKVTFEDAARALSQEIQARLSSTPWKTTDLDRIRLSERAALLRLWEKPHYFGLDRAADIAAAGWDFARDRVRRLSWVEMADLNDLAKHLARPENWATFMTGPDAPDDLGAASLARSAVAAEVERPTAQSRELVSRWKGAQRPAEPDAGAALSAKSGAPPQGASNVRTVLPNGLHVTLDYSEDSRIFAAHVLIKNRSAAEPAGKSGIVEMLHRLAGSGTREHPGAALEAELESIGGTLKVADDPAIPYDDIYLSPEYSYIRLEALDEFAPRALDLLAEILSEPMVEDQTQVEMAREGAMARARQAEASPKERCRMLLARGLWGESHPFAAPPFGTERSLKSITLDDLRAFHASYFHPRNVILGIGTSIRPDAMLPMLEAKLGRWSSTAARGPQPAGPPVAAAPLASPGARPRFASERLEAPQASLMWGRLVAPGAPGGEAMDEATVRAVAAVLSRRMVDTLREKKGLTYSAGAEATALGGRIQITASMGLLPGQETAARDALRDVLVSLGTAPPGAQEVEEAVGSSSVRGLMRSLSRINRAWSRCLAELRPGAATAAAPTPQRVAEAARSLGAAADASSSWYEALVSPATPSQEAPPDAGSITGKGLMEHVHALGAMAAQAGVDTSGHQAAATYVERLFRQIGLSPGSEAGPFIDRYRQSFVKTRVTESGPSEVRVDREAGKSAFPARAFPFAPPELPPEPPAAAPEEAGESIFLDPEDLAAMAGIPTPPRFEGGTIVTVERQAEPLAPDAGAMLAAQVVGSARMGASALVIVRSSAGPSTYESLLSDPLDGDLRLPFAGTPPAMLVLSAGPDLGAELMGRQLFLRHANPPTVAVEPAFRPMPLDLALTVTTGLKTERQPMVNIVGVAPGRDPALAGEAVLVTAPYTASENGDGSGIAALIETARMLAGGPVPRTSRSLVFAATDGGESGLAGSRALASRLSEFSIRPTSVVSLGTLGEPVLVTAPGPPRIGETARDMAAKLGITLDAGVDLAGAEPEERLLPFHLAGVPSIRISTASRANGESNPLALEKAARFAALIVWALGR